MSLTGIIIAVVIALLAGTTWAFINKNWLLAFIGLSLLSALVVWIVLLLKSVQSTYLYAGTRAGMERIAKSLQTYHKDKGRFPPELKVEDLADSTLPGPREGFGYTLKVTEDSFVLSSWARDGKPGGEGFDEDIFVFWKKGDLHLNVKSADIAP
jgi:hypothetical protein